MVDAVDGLRADRGWFNATRADSGHDEHPNEKSRQRVAPANYLIFRSSCLPGLRLADGEEDAED